MQLRLTIDQAIDRAEDAMNKGRHDLARKLFQAVLVHDPGHVIAREGIAAIPGRFSSRPQDPPPHRIEVLHNLYAKGLMAETEHECQILLKTYPQSLTVSNILGVSLQAQGKFRRAIQAFDRVINLNPDFPEAHNNKAIVLKALGRLEAARQCCEKAIQIKPDYAEAHNNLGIVFTMLNMAEPARQAFEKAVRVKPDYAEAYNNLGAVLGRLGQPDAAAEAFGKAIQLRPDDPDKYINRGVLQQMYGRFEDARKNYLAAIRVRPECAQAHRYLSELKIYRIGDPQIAEMQALLETSPRSDRDRMNLNFALGKAFTDIRLCDKAFRHLKEGNRLRKKSLPYTIQSDEKMFAALRSLFERPEAVPLRGGPGRLKQTPVFILGMLRSGTTLVEQILSSHSQVNGAGELKLLSRILKETPSVFTGLTVNDLRQIRQAYLSGLSDTRFSGYYITDKMPINFQWIGFIIHAMPEAKIVHVKRDASATCWSIFKHCFTDDGNRYANDLEDVARFFNLYKDLMQFWHEKFPGKIYDLDYEALTMDQESETRKLLDYIGLEWEDSCLAFHKTERPVNTASSQQVRQKMYQGSSQAWRKFEKHLLPMKRILEKTI